MNSIQSKSEEALLVATIEGAEVKDHRIEADHLARVLEALQKSLRNFATEILAANGSKLSRRQRILAQKSVTLEVIAFASDSFSVKFTLAHPDQTRDHLSEEIGRRALTAMVKSLQSIGAPKEQLRSVNGHNVKSLAPFAKMAPLLQDGLQQIRLSIPAEAGLSAVLTQEVCLSLEEKLLWEEHSPALEAEQPAFVLKGAASQKLTADLLLHSPLVGIWSDRTDISDSSEFARALRDEAGSRER